MFFRGWGGAGERAIPPDREPYPTSDPTRPFKILFRFLFQKCVNPSQHNDIIKLPKIIIAKNSKIWSIPRIGSVQGSGKGLGSQVSTGHVLR